MADNRRKHERVPAQRVRVRVASMDALRTTYLRDLSAGGIFFRTEKFMPLGSDVTIELFPPGASKSLKLKSRVVRHANDDAARVADAVGMGLAFESLAPEAQSALDELIADCKKTADNPEAAAQEALIAARREAAELKVELAELKNKLTARTQEVGTLETDEAAARALAEQLAGDLANLERQLKETRAAHADEKERGKKAAEAAAVALRQEQERASGQLTALRRELDGQRQRVLQVEEELAAERSQAALRQSEVDELKAQAERAKAKEREVRRLLALMSSPSSPTGAVTDAAPEPPAPARPVPPPLPAPEATAPAAPVPVPWVEAVPASEGGDSMEESFHSTTMVMFDAAPKEPGTAPIPAVAAPSTHVESPLPPTNAPLAFEAFSDRLQSGGRISRTPKFNLHTPTDPVELLLASLLETMESMDELRRMTQGRVPEDRVRHVLYGFYSRSLISVSP